MKKIIYNSYISYALILCFVLMVGLCSGGSTVVNAAVSPVKKVYSSNYKINLLAVNKIGQTKAKLTEVALMDTNKNSTSAKLIEAKKFDQLALPVKGDEVAVIKTKIGVIKMRLLSNYAPKAVEIFKNRVNSGFYDGLSFNKLIGNSIVQGGTSPQNNTISTNTNFNVDEYNPEIRNYRGAVSIASGDAGSIDQFVIVQAGPAKIVKDTLNFMKSSGETQFPKAVINKYQKVGGAPWLDYHNVIFGQVFAGMDVVDKISKSAVDESNLMKKEVKITKITIEIFKK